MAGDTTSLPTMAVGFVDLVGFTRLSASTDPEGVGTVLAAFEDVASRAADDAGDVLVREGDYVGTTVNTAARLTDLAHPGSLVVDTAAADVLAGYWQTSRLPPKRLKGLGTTRATRVRRPEPDGGT